MPPPRLSIPPPSHNLRWSVYHNHIFNQAHTIRTAASPDHLQCQRRRSCLCSCSHIHAHTLNHTPLATRLRNSKKTPMHFSALAPPLRQTQPRIRRPFSTSRPIRADHYATLNLPPTASQPDIKKAFYTLSKRHHPDRNPHNQEEASAKFVACSDAYAVLGNPSKRAAYDRSHGFSSPSPSSSAGSTGPVNHAGSYSSASAAAGGRPASGLSRRRGAFRGPPPSFYKNGGWGEGASAQKRRSNAYTESHAHRDARSSEESFAREGASKRMGEERTEARADDFPFSGPNDVPHFDRGRHFRRTTSIEEQLRRGRAKRRRVVMEEEEEAMRVHDLGAGTELRSFVLIGAVIFIGVGVPVFFVGQSQRSTSSVLALGGVDDDGSKRRSSRRE